MFRLSPNNGNLTITNNVVLGDNGAVLPCYGMKLAQCLSQVVQSSNVTNPNLVVNHAKTNIPSSNVVVSNNVVAGLSIEFVTVNLTMSGNICLSSTANVCHIGVPVNGKMVWSATPGQFGDGNRISPETPGQAFALFDITSAKYNLNLSGDKSPTLLLH